MGGTAYAINEKQQRSSFQETKRSLLDKLTMEQQSKEQVGNVECVHSRFKDNQINLNRNT